LSLLDWALILDYNRWFRIGNCATEITECSASTLINTVDFEFRFDLHSWFVYWEFV